MSQKSRRARRQTIEEDPPFKAPTPKPNGVEESPPITEAPKESTPPLEASPVEEETPKEEEVVENETTKSRSPTPEVKKIVNGHENEEQDNSAKEEMESLIVTDEPDPELAFEESSDLESGRESPILSRCKTRRSLTRNIPTPKTPNSVAEEDTGKSGEDTPTEEAGLQDGEEEQELNVTFESCSENFSTKVEVGSDTTRMNYTESNLEANSFLHDVKNKSFGETLKRLSTRRTIRPISDDYRKRLLQNNLEKNDLGVAYPTRNSVERLSVGSKRKNASDDDEAFTKRFKSESSGLFARLTSPLISIRSTFRKDLPSSTPKLTGYKDEKCMLEEDGVSSKMCEVRDGERRWCSVM